MVGRTFNWAVTIFVVIALLLSTISIDEQERELQKNVKKMEQLGGGGSLEDQCSSITFEDLFDYSSAIFYFEISEDWESATVTATAWVNGTSTDDLRTSLDSYLEDLLPSGGDGWISTDEREAVRAIASECIEHALTRIAFREGEAHRGGVGIDWKNTTWQSNGVEIKEWNLIPPNHAEKRDCETLGSSSDCYEIPVAPNNDRDCNTAIDASSGIDECRLELWMNATLMIPDVEFGQQYTLAFNSSNVTQAVYEFTFPPTSDLRIDMWEECEGRDVSFEPATHADAPIRGTCLGDGSSSYTLIENSEGNLIYTLSPVRTIGMWPSGEDIFADFTTTPIPIDEPPIWTENSPTGGSWFPSPNGGDTRWASWDSISEWFTDEGPVSQLDVVCIGDSTLNLRQSMDNSLWAEIPTTDIVEVTCEAVDSAGQNSGNRTWYLGVPFTISTNSQTMSNPHEIIVAKNIDWPTLQIEVGFSQNGEIGVSEATTLDSESITIAVASTNMIPGGAQVWVSASGENVFSMNYVYELGIFKESLPPLISVSESGWDGSFYQAQGQFSDPDGEAVSFSLAIDGTTAGSISVSGNSWSTPRINFELWESGEHSLLITGCDESQKCSEVVIDINNTHLFEETIIEPGDKNPDTDTGILPSASFSLTLLSITIGLIYSTRRD